MKTYTINDFEIGEVVYLKSDLHQAMAISDIDVKENMIRCYWRDKKKNQSINEIFPPAVLCKGSDIPAPKIYTL
ncbi:MAG: hypothetical protein HZB98_15065 [Bacteroidia bacterium]|nr:hypothetical protein [Bacteroidia bacterium]